MLVYVHVPFCRRRCRYCAFHSSAIGAAPVPKEYLATLRQEIAWWAEHLPAMEGSTTVESIYLGGGTPTLLQAEELSGILGTIASHFHLSSDCEISLEANPDSLLRPGLARALRTSGFNRLSIGMQSMDDADLRMLGRVHDLDESRRAFSCAREAGFENISLDLMWGLPGQDTASWLKTLERAVDLGPEHISAYALTLEEDTPMGRDAADGRIVLPGEEEERRMYLEGGDFLLAHGYAQYEVSNYARTGFRCRHNMGYWKGTDYLGMGPSAVSTMGGCRWSDASELATWQKDVEERMLGLDTEDVGGFVHSLESVMLSLRTCDGISAQAYGKLTGRDLLADHGDYLRALENAGLAALDEEGGVRLTREGLLVSNPIISDFFDRMERLERQETPFGNSTPTEA